MKPRIAGRHAGLFTLTLLAVVLGGREAHAARLDDVAVRVGSTGDVDDADLASVSLAFVTDNDPKLLTYLGDDIRYDVTIGGFFDNGGDDDIDVAFIHSGPTWRYQPDFLWSGNFIEIGTALTYLEDDTIGRRDLGGHWQFTSHATIGHQFGEARRWRVGLRLQHTSNAGIDSPNPGIDAALLEVGYRF